MPAAPIPMPTPALMSLPDLMAMSTYAPDSASPLAAPHLVAVALQAGDKASLQQTAAAIQRLSCPVVAVAPEAHPLSPAFDVRVDSAEDLQLLTHNIARSPLAASVLVQVLRHTEGMALAPALLVESLAYATLQGGAEFKRWCALPRHMPAPARDGGSPVTMERDAEAQQLLVRLNRPASRNALSVELRDALLEALQLVMADATITTVRISGNGSCFSIGGDLSEFGQLPDPASAHFIRALRSPAHFLAQCADRVEFHVHSACIGAGVELAAFGRQVLAEPNAFFQLPELRFGLIPGAGGCVAIPRRIGRQRTAYMALSMKKISAATALRWGLVDAIAA